MERTTNETRSTRPAPRNGTCRHCRHPENRHDEPGWPRRRCREQVALGTTAQRTCPCPGFEAKSAAELAEEHREWSGLCMRCAHTAGAHPAAFPGDKIRRCVDKVHSFYGGNRLSVDCGCQTYVPSPDVKAAPVAGTRRRAYTEEEIETDLLHNPCVCGISGILCTALRHSPPVRPEPKAQGEQ